MNEGGYIPNWGEPKPVGYYPGEDPTPTPIDPADIRPGDVVRLIDKDGADLTFTVESRNVHGGVVAMLAGCRIVIHPDSGTWHLVHRPDPDAEAVEALAGASHAHIRLQQSGKAVAGTILESLREQGWDVTRRQP